MIFCKFFNRLQFLRAVKKKLFHGNAGVDKKLAGVKQSQSPVFFSVPLPLNPLCFGVISHCFCGISLVYSSFESLHTILDHFG